MLVSYGVTAKRTLFAFFALGNKVYTIAYHICFIINIGFDPIVSQLTVSCFFLAVNFK